MKNFIFFLLALISQVAFANSYVTTHGAVDQVDYNQLLKGTTQLVATSNQVQVFATTDNGSFQILQMSDAQHLPNDWWLEIQNNSPGFITVRDHGGNFIASVNSNRIGKFFLKSNATVNGQWVYNTPAAVADIITYHGQLSGLGDDDHLQYHNDARGDSRYYTKTQFINNSNGASDADKPVKTNASGQVADSFLPNTISSDITGNAATATALLNSPAQCSVGQVATGINANGSANCTAAGAGDVTGPGSSTDRGIAIFNGTGGDVIQDSGATIDATGNVAAIGFTGPLNGNATTSGAFDHNPSACSVGNFVTDIAADGTLTCSTPAGSGDVSSNTSSSVDGEIALFSGTGGKTIKRATGTGLAKITSGVLGTATSGTDYAPATSGISILKGNGSGGFSNAASGTDYAPATSGSSILYGNGSGGFSNVTVGTGLSFSGGTLSSTVSGTVTTVSVASANGFAGSVANATTTPAITLSTTITGLLKGNGTAISAASSGTDYAPATSGSSILYGNGSGGFNNVTVGSGLTFSAGTLSASGGSVSSDDNMIYVTDPNGYGSTNTTVRRYNTIARYQGSLVTYADSATNGASFTIATGGGGAWQMCAAEYWNGTSPKVGITKNGASLTTSIASITRANGRLGYESNSNTTTTSTFCTIRNLADGDVIRVQTTGSEPGSDNRSWFYMTRLGDSSGEAILYTGNGFGSPTNVYIRRFSNTSASGSSTITQSATNGDRIDIGATKLYGICYSDGGNSSGMDLGLSINASSLSTDSFNLSRANGRILYHNHGDSGIAGACFVKRLASGDLVRSHQDGTANDTSDAPYLSVVEIDGSADGYAAAYTGAGTGTETKKPYFTSKDTQRGTDVTVINSSYSGTTFVVNNPGVYSTGLACDVNSATSPIATVIDQDRLGGTNSSTAYEYIQGVRAFTLGGASSDLRKTMYAQYFNQGQQVSFRNDGGTERAIDGCFAYMTRTK